MAAFLHSLTLDIVVPLSSCMAMTSMRRGFVPATLAAAACALLSACGGSDDAPTVAAAPANPAASAPPAGERDRVDLQSAELPGQPARAHQPGASERRQLRQRRRFRRRAPLAWNDRLTAAADAHSEDMSAKNYFSHTSADGRTLVDRVNAAGYAWTALGENIAAGYRTVDAVMNGWIASPGHCANLMNAGFAEVGVACVPGVPGNTYATYWTMELGRPR